MVHQIYEDTSNKRKIQAGIFLAYLLYDNGMKISSLYTLQSILLYKSQSGLIPLIFKIIVKIMGEIKNDYVVSNFFRSIDTTKLSYDNIDAIRYYYGKALFKEEKYERARKYFAKINPMYHNGKYYNLSRYYLATIAYIQDNKQKALPYLDEIYATDKKLPLELIAQARLFSARIYSDLEQLEKATEHYAKVPKESITWDQALLEASWIYLRQENYEKVVGRTHSLNSPYFKMYYFPDGYVIEALGYLKLCRFARAKLILDEFEKTYKKYLPMLKKAKPTYYGLYKNKKELPMRVVKTIARTNHFRAYHKGLQRIRYERAVLKRFKRYARRKHVFSKNAMTFYKLFEKKFRAQKRHHVAKLDEYLQLEVKAMIDKLKELYQKFEFIQYELFAQAKRHLEGSLVDDGSIVISDEERKASASNRLYIWKFDYEYWYDELPFYEYAGVDLCQ
jgi:tetratricopeptide (TPR) repeat protein